MLIVTELDVVKVYTVPLCFNISWREVFEEDLGIYSVYLDSVFSDPESDEVRRKNHGRFRLEIVDIGPIFDLSYL
jgi:hypothetical protein